MISHSQSSPWAPYKAESPKAFAMPSSVVAKINCNTAINSGPNLHSLMVAANTPPKLPWHWWQQLRHEFWFDFGFDFLLIFGLIFHWFFGWIIMCCNGGNRVVLGWGGGWMVDRLCSLDEEREREIERKSVKWGRSESSDQWERK